MSDVKNYAIVDMSGDIVNIVSWDGEFPFDPGDGLTLVLIPDGLNVGLGIGWTCIDGVFIPPPPPVIIPPTPEEILKANTDELSWRSQAAGGFIASAIYARFDFGDGTDEATLHAKAWQGYYIALQAVDLTVEHAAWPDTPGG